MQGEGGVNIPQKDYLKEVKKICDRADIVLIFDEVQTGMGRTGKWFGKDHFGVQPDVMCVAKGIAGGFPMGVMMATENVARPLPKATMPPRSAAARWPARPRWAPSKPWKRRSWSSGPGTWATT